MGRRRGPHPRRRWRRRRRLPPGLLSAGAGRGAAGFALATPGSFGSNGTGDRGFAPIRPGRLLGPSWTKDWARPCRPARRGSGPGRPRRRSRWVPALARARPRLRTTAPGVRVPPPRAARLGSAALGSGSAASVGAFCVGTLARPRRSRRAPRATRPGSPERLPGRYPRSRRRDARARAAMTRATRLAHMPPRAPRRLLLRADLPLLRYAARTGPALAVDVLAVNIDHATESMCDALGARALGSCRRGRGSFAPRGVVDVARGKPESPARVRSRRRRVSVRALL